MVTLGACWRSETGRINGADPAHLSHQRAFPKKWEDRGTEGFEIPSGLLQGIAEILPQTVVEVDQ